MDIVSLTETRGPGIGETSSGGGYTYYWFGMNDGTCLGGETVRISNWMQLEYLYTWMGDMLLPT